MNYHQRHFSKYLPPSNRVSRTLPPMTITALIEIIRLDQSLAGTPDYMGVYSFWDGQSEFRSELGDATPLERAAVHDAIIAAGLKPGGRGDHHSSIIKRFKLCEKTNDQNSAAIAEGDLTLSMTVVSIAKMISLDDAFVGTPNYMGMASFWHDEFEDVLSLLSYHERVATHRALLEAGLPVDGCGGGHKSVIVDAFNKFREHYGIYRPISDWNDLRVSL
jgi:hypothetical protein